MSNHNRRKAMIFFAIVSIVGAGGPAFGMVLTFECFEQGIEARPGYHAVRGVALSPDESFLYAAHWQSGSVPSDDPIAVYSPPECPLEEVCRIDGGQCVGNVVVSNDGRYAYAPEYYGGYIHRYDTSDCCDPEPPDCTPDSIDLGSWAQNVWKAPNGEQIIVHYNATCGGCPSSHHALAIIDISGDNFCEISFRIPLGRPLSGINAAFSADGEHIYLSGGASETTGPTLLGVNLVDGEIDCELELVDAPAQQWYMAGVVRVGGTLYIGDKTGGMLHVVDEASCTKTDEISVPDSPWNIALHPDGHHLFIMYGDSGTDPVTGTVSVMDLSTLSEVTSLSGLNPGVNDAVFNAGGTKVYISHYDQEFGGVSVITIGPDCNNNGIADSGDRAYCDGDTWCDDCNGNGVLDECDIADGTSRDRFPFAWDFDGVPDECQQSLPMPNDD